MVNLTLEIREQGNATPVYLAGDGEVVGMSTPPIDEDYWSFRVRLTPTQAVVGFPKFSTIGIGFAVEDASWNTNLPYTTETGRIFEHIACNKGDDAISDADVLEAIRMVQEAATASRV